MSLIKRQRVSAAQLAANRQNALKSTGPRTPGGKRRARLNALKHGLFARPFRKGMKDLGEDPRKFDFFHRELVVSVEPGNALEAKIVEDMALLWWKKARSERAQVGVQLQEVNRMLVAREREFQQVNRLATDEPIEELRKLGLVRAKPSRDKFETALELLGALIARLERGRGWENQEDTLRGLFGPHPSWRGCLILDYYRRLMEGQEFEPSEDNDDPPETPSSGDDPPETPGNGAEQRFSIRAALVLLLMQEQRDLTEEYELFLREHIQISSAEHDACLAPTDSRWALILRLDNYLDRQLERKMRMLLKLRSLRLRSGPSAVAFTPACAEKKILKVKKRSRHVAESPGASRNGFANTKPVSGRSEQARGVG